MRAARASRPAKDLSVAGQNLEMEGMGKAFLGMLGNEAQELIRGQIMKSYMPGEGVQSLL